MEKIFLHIAFAVLFAGCLPKPAQPGVEETMQTFFHALASGDYKTAVNLYGGDYEALIHMNPSVSPTDYGTLWQNGCQQNGFVCMEVLDVVSVIEGDMQTKFTITFKTKDGERFEFTGCCGKTLPEPITEYAIIVKMDADGNYKVLSLPPYVP